MIIHIQIRVTCLINVANCLLGNNIDNPVYIDCYLRTCQSYLSKLAICIVIVLVPAYLTAVLEYFNVHKCCNQLYNILALVPALCAGPSPHFNATKRD